MGGMKSTITAFQVDFGDGPKEYLTCVEIERLSKGRGIPVEALIGMVLQPRENPGDPITPDNFCPAQKVSPKRGFPPPKLT
jgi:hypothetical protein